MQNVGFLMTRLIYSSACPLLQMLEFYRSGSHLGVPVYLEEDKSDSDRVKAMKRKTFEIIKQCWVLDESEMVLPERIIRDINQGVGNYGENYGWACIF